MPAKKILWEEHTWPELRAAAQENRVVVLPVGTIEQHGPHLPLSTDCITSREISRCVVERIRDEALLMPQVYYSFNFHHLDFPSPVRFQEFFSRNSRTGIKGDPTTASAEKGRRVVECVVENLIELVREFRARPILPRVDHH